MSITAAHTDVCPPARSQEARGERGPAGGGELHLPRHPVPAALPTGEGLRRGSAPDGRGKGKERTPTHGDSRRHGNQTLTVLRLTGTFPAFVRGDRRRVDVVKLVQFLLHSLQELDPAGIIRCFMFLNRQTGIPESPWNQVNYRTRAPRAASRAPDLDHLMPLGVRWWKLTGNGTVSLI